MRLTSLPQPFIVAVSTDRTIEAAKRTVTLALEQGAHAVELNLPALHRCADRELAHLLRWSPLPIYTSCLRPHRMEIYGIDRGSLPAWSDAERMERLLWAAAHGACAIDIALDTFDARGCLDAPEITDDPAAVRRQRDVAARAHRAGADVMFTCRTGQPMTGAQLIGIAQRALDRGGDLLEIVMPCATDDDLRTLFRATSHLSAVSPIPFVLLGVGNEGLASRTLGPKFGSCWYIAQTERKPGGFQEQPLVSEVVGGTPLVPWCLEV